MTGRRTKLAIAVAILIVGIGAACLFPRDDATETPTAAKKTTPPVTADPSRSVDPKASPGSEPTLAGRIEPYGWDQKPLERTDQSIVERPPETFSTDSMQRAVASQPSDEEGRSTAEWPASYATTSGGNQALGERASKRSTDDRSTSPVSAA